MITADLHNHTLYSHGKDSVEAMWKSAQDKGISLFGFTEHSPRPNNYTYTNEYREKLTKFFPKYVAEVLSLKQLYPEQILLGIEMDWMEKEVDFIKKALGSYDFDYVIGSVHFLKTWGYDDDPMDWKKLNQDNCHIHYANYFKTVGKMASSGLFNIAAHLDLIKIFSIEYFGPWIKTAKAQNIVGDTLTKIKEAHMSLEVSSAGLRKVCKEIYPCPEIMQMAKELKLPISFGSDAHNVNDVGADFDKLALYARKYDYEHSVWFCQGQMFTREF